MNEVLVVSILFPSLFSIEIANALKYGLVIRFSAWKMHEENILSTSPALRPGCIIIIIIIITTTWGEERD